MPPAADASALCQRCGLCCDGSLFDHAPLAAAEVDAARRRLVVLARPDGGHALRQPCAALVERRCAAYDLRPAACRTYRCMLLAALDAGEIDAGEAAAVVDEAHARLADLAARLPAGPGSAVQRARAADDPDLAPLRERALAFLARRLRGLGRA